MRNSTLKVLFYIAFCSLILTTMFGIKFSLTPIINDGKGYIYEIKPGMSAKLLVADMHNQGLVKYPFFMDALIFIKRAKYHLKAGEYLIPYHSTPLNFIDQITQGRGLINHPFTIIPGTTFQQVRENLNQNPLIRHTTLNMTDAMIMRKLGSILMSEGQFFPDTYFYHKWSTDLFFCNKALWPCSKNYSLLGKAEPQTYFLKMLMMR